MVIEFSNGYFCYTIFVSQGVYGFINLLTFYNGTHNLFYLCCIKNQVCEIYFMPTNNTYEFCGLSVH
jgi:hypothetical protein